MPDDRKPFVSLIYPELHEQAAIALGRAFIDDPMFMPLVPEIADSARRAAVFRDLFRAMFAVERKTGQPTFGVIGDGKVVAAAVTEGVGHPSMLEVTTAGLGQFPRLVRALGWGGVQRALMLFRILSSNHPARTPSIPAGARRRSRLSEAALRKSAAGASARAGPGAPGHQWRLPGDGH